MNEKLLQARELCLDQAASFIEAAKRLSENWPHIVYHLSLLALEETGKASMLGAKMLDHPNLDGQWIDRSIDNHRRKLLWAVWSPMQRIDPSDFEAARNFADRAHSIRLISLYVDPDATSFETAPSDNVTVENAHQTLSLAEARLSYERQVSVPSGEIDELTEWFLNTMADPDGARLLLSGAFRDRYTALGGDTRKWVSWARDEMARIDRESSELLQIELAKPGASKELAKPRWRANATVYSIRHHSDRLALSGMC